MSRQIIPVLILLTLLMPGVLSAEDLSLDVDGLISDIDEAAKEQQRWHEEQMRANPGYRHRKTGDAHLEQGQFKEAITEYDASLKFTPDDPSTYLQKGIAEINIGQHNAAVQSMETAIRINTRSDTWLAWPYMYMGFAYGYLGEFNLSTVAFSDSLRHQKFVKSYIGRAAAYVQQGNLDQALQDYDAALAMEPNSAELWTAKALLHMRLMAGNIDSEHFGESCEAMQKACDLGDCRAISEFVECADY